MKKNVILTAIFTLFLMVSANFAQDKTSDYLGSWTLDTSKSKLGKMISKGIKSQTLNIKQDGSNFIIETNTQSASTDKPATVTDVYRTTESVKTSLVGGRFGGVTTQSLQFRKKNKLELRSELSSDNLSMSVKDTWSLSEDGKTLTIKRISSASGKGTETSSNMYTTWVFTKQ